MWPKHSAQRAGRRAPTPRFAQGGLAAVLVFFASYAAAIGPDEAARLLRKADSVRTSNYGEFAAILRVLEDPANSLSTAQQEHLHYLQAWKSGYDGDTTRAIAELTPIFEQSQDVTLRFRAGATSVNLLALAKQRYEEAFSRLSQVLALLPRISDKDAREQGLLGAAELYYQVGQYDLNLRYAQMVIDENWAGRGACKGAQQKLRSLYESGKLKTLGLELQAGIEECTKAGEINYANSIRINVAKLFIKQKKLDDAIKVLKEHYGEVTASRNPRIISTYDALLAEAYRRKGIPALAGEFARHGIQSVAKDRYTEPLVDSYGVLYELAKAQNDFKSALAFHEQYAVAAKGYMDDVSARHLAYQKVSHENIANKLQVDALNKQNHVLQLERQLGAKAAETSRLYIALLTLSVFSIALWAYRTKRSQLHFMSLSQLDGLTGICNRPYFMEQAQKALENGEKTGEQFCIALCDLDHFKAINDSLGHAAGDHVLKRTVAECQAHLGAAHIFGRFGGEEFGVLFPACEPRDAWQLSEQLRVAIASIVVEQGGEAPIVTASFGIASTSSSGYELRQLLAHADAALYDAKRAGRNRVVMYEEGTLTADVLQRAS